MKNIFLVASPALTHCWHIFYHGPKTDDLVTFFIPSIAFLTASHSPDNPRDKQLGNFASYRDNCLCERSL